jgi:hypothetical protein
MSIGTPTPAVNAGSPPKPSNPPTSCPHCLAERTWWPATSGEGFTATCPWCDDTDFTADPDEIDTALEPTPLAPSECEGQ